MTGNGEKPSADAPEPAAIPGARSALILLLLINLFNYIDRQVLAAVEPQIREEFFTDPTAVAGVIAQLGTPHYGPLFTVAALYPETRDFPGRLEKRADHWWKSGMFLMGLLPSAFLLTYMLASPVFGWLANRMSRWLLVGIGVIVWSLASGASGLAGFFVAMLLTRCLIGVGEAVYGPVAPDMISDLYPVERRGQVMAWFYAAIPVGGALGYALGVGARLATGSWRTGFYLVVIPGLLLGVLCFLMREPPRGQTSGPATGLNRRERLADYMILLRTPSYVLCTLGMAAMVFAMGGLAYWVAGYFAYRKVGPLFGFHPTIAFGGLLALTGLGATLVGGWVGDWLRPRWSGSYFLVSGAAMVLAFPMLLLMVEMDFPQAWVPLTLFAFLLFFNTGPTNTILANVAHPLLRAPGFAVNILVIHLLGDVISPPIMGAIASRSNLDRAFQFVSVMVLLGGVLWIWGARYLERDTALAPTRLPD
jgi:MFS family permease